MSNQRAVGGKYWRGLESEGGFSWGQQSSWGEQRAPQNGKKSCEEKKRTLINKNMLINVRVCDRQGRQQPGESERARQWQKSRRRRWNRNTL